MKLKNKALLSSVLILSLSVAGINSVKASDDLGSDLSVESTEEKNEDNVTSLDNKEKVYSKITLYVKNRRAKDWLKDGSYYRIEGQDAKQFLQYRDQEKIVIDDKLVPGEKQKIEILDGKDGKVYAEGEINVIKDAKDWHKIDVEIIPKIPIKTRKMTLKFKDKKNESRSLPSGKNYMFVDGKLIREIDGFSDRIENFEYEVGKKFKIEFRRKDKADSELLASIEDEMPAEGKLVESESKDVYLRFPTDPKDDEKDSEKGSASTPSPKKEKDKKTDQSSENPKKGKDGKNNSNESNPSSNENPKHSSNNPSDEQPKGDPSKDKKITVTPVPGDKDDKDKISEKSYPTREEAIDAAKKEMQTNSKWKSYYLIEQEDGSFKYGLSEKEDKNQSESSSQNKTGKLVSKANNSTQKPKSAVNVKTGVAGVGAVVGVLLLAIIGYFVTKKKK